MKVFIHLSMKKIYLFDFSLEKKIILCSPITLYAVLSLIRQAISNFSMGEKAGEMQDYVGIFKQQWGEYILQMTKFQGTLDTLNNHFEKLITTRRNQLEKPMGKILGLQLGQTEENLEIKR